jgi:hypothetical protein
MRIFIDCEWNDFKGELISMALVSEHGHEFYEVVPCDKPSEWIAKNVMPILDKAAIPFSEMQWRLQFWLSQFHDVHIIADWPEDIKHFCDALIVGSGLRINTPPLTMEVLRIDSESKLPHNALFDARALREKFISIMENHEHIRTKTKA